MNCEQARLLLLEQLYGELDPRSRVGLDRHRDECAACRQAGEEFGAVEQQLSRWSTIEDPVDHASLRPTRAQARIGRPARGWRPALVGMAAALLLFVLLLLTSARLTVGAAGIQLTLGAAPATQAPGVGPVGSAEVTEDPLDAEVVRAIVDESLSLQLASSMERISDALDDADHIQRRRFEALVEALEVLRTQDRTRQVSRDRAILQGVGRAILRDRQDEWVP